MSEYPEWGMKSCTLDQATANGISYAVKRVERPDGGREIFFVAGIEEPDAVSPSEVARAIRRKERLVPALLRAHGRNA